MSSSMTRAERVALAVATLASFVTPFMAASVTVALPAIGRTFGLDAVTLGWIVTAYLLTATTFLVPLGRASDLHGRKRLFAAGILVYTFGSLLCALAPSAALLIGARAGQGIGAAMIFGSSLAILTSVVAAERRGMAIGITVAAVYLGLSLGPPVGGFLTSAFGWRSIFALNVALGLPTAIVVMTMLEGEWADARGRRFDWGGAVLYALALPAVMYGFTRLPAAGGLWLCGLGTLALVGFVAWERSFESPLIDVRLFARNRVFTFSNVAALINYSATAAVAFLLSLYLQWVRGLSPQEAGFVLLVQPIVQAVVSPAAGRLSDRVESRVVASIGMAVIVVGLFLLALTSPRAPLVWLASCLALLGAGFGLFSSPNTNAVMGAVERPHYGVASAILASMRLVGQTFSLSVATLVIAVHVGRVQITPALQPAFMAAFRATLWLFAVLSIAGVFASLARGPQRARHGPRR